MKSLLELHTFLDKSHFDHTNLPSIRQAYIDFLDNPDKGTSDEYFHLADLEWQAMNIRKSFDHKLNPEEGTLDGLSWQAAGTQPLEDGSEISMYWPDVQKLTDEDYAYFEKRWNETSNPYIKNEFGLLVYFGGRSDYSKHQSFADELFVSIFEHTKNYRHKIAQETESKAYYSYLIANLKLMIGIAFKSKLKTRLRELSGYLEALQKDEQLRKRFPRILADISFMAAENYAGFKKMIDFDAMLGRNSAELGDLSSRDLWAGIHLVNQSLKIVEKQNKEANHLYLEKAKLYERLADQALESNPITESTFIVDAMKLFKSAGDEEGFERMQKRYTQHRGKLELSVLKQEIPGEVIEELNQRINQTIESANEQNILVHLIVTPWYEQIEAIEQRAAKGREDSTLLSMMPVAILDKFGNAIARFIDAEAIQKYHFLSAYGANFQWGTFTMVQFVLRAIKVQKLSLNTILDHLAKTWMNDSIPRLNQNDKVEVYPIDTLKPVLARFFIEIGNHLSGNTSELDLVTLIDSMTLKVEQLIRQFCTKADIPTFKRKRGNDDIVMEKTLDELLAELEIKPETENDNLTNFDENHRQMIKFVLTEKVGWNLRNEVAHGLLELNEYTIEKPIVLLSIILKLSGYTFVKQEEG